jgi:NO-binding membrane sensor protein with MHYT domain
MLRAGERKMFETLGPSEQPVKYRWLLLTFYGTYCLVALVWATHIVRRHGLSQPARLALSCSLFFLSLMWLVATLRSGTSLSGRKVRFRNIILLLVFLALNSLSELSR